MIHAKVSERHYEQLSVKALFCVAFAYIERERCTTVSGHTASLCQGCIISLLSLAKGEGGGRVGSFETIVVHELVCRCRGCTISSRLPISYVELFLEKRSPCKSLATGDYEALHGRRLRGH